MPPFPFRAEDTAELAEILDFLGDWLESDRELLAASLARFVGDPDCGPSSLSDGCARFRHLLGFTDGEDAAKADAKRTPRESSPPGEPACGSPDAAAGAPGARTLDADAVAEIPGGLKTASLTGLLDAADALESLSYIRRLSLAIECGELALIEAARCRGIPWTVISQALCGTDVRRAAEERHADLARSRGSLMSWDALNGIPAEHRLDPPRLRLSVNGEVIPQYRYASPVTTRRHVIWQRHGGCREDVFPGTGLP